MKVPKERRYTDTTLSLSQPKVILAFIVDCRYTKHRLDEMVAKDCQM